MRLLFFIAFAAFINLILALPVYATGPTNYTYTYNEWLTPVPSPDAYRVADFVLGENLGIGRFDRPQDLAFHDDKIYVADTFNNRIVILTGSRPARVLQIIDSVIMPDGSESGFDRPHGVFVSNWDGFFGQIWIADTHNQRILRIDGEETLNVIDIIDRSKMDNSLLAENLDFLPQKLAVDFSERLFLQAQHVNRGLMEFDSNGYFSGYMGAPPVEVSPIDQFWRLIATREQRERRALFVPIEYNNITVDSQSFLYVTTASSDVDPVRRLNAMGADVMIRNGMQEPIGDSWYGTAAGISGPSQFIDVAPLPNDSFAVFDRNRGRIFAYDSQGELLYAWGGVGNREGFFMSPTALIADGLTLFALDAATGAITRFELTEYGRYVNAAMDMYRLGLYDQSVHYWQEVMRMNGNFGLSYIGMARAYLRQGEYLLAMDLFRSQNSYINYGRAFGFFRRQWMEENFWIFIVVLAGLVIVPWTTRNVIRIRKEILES